MADTELDDVAARALASIILERTADTLRDGGMHAAVAITGLAEDTGLVLDVCAAILQATSWLAGTGQLSDVTVYSASVAMQPDDTDPTT